MLADYGVENAAELFLCGKMRVVPCYFRKYSPEKSVYEHEHGADKDLLLRHGGVKTRHV
jgi:hypothetical protein